MVDARRSDTDATFCVVLKRRQIKEICKIYCSVGIIFLQNVICAVFVAVIFVQNVKYFILLGVHICAKCKIFYFIGGSYLCKM